MTNATPRASALETEGGRIFSIATEISAVADVNHPNIFAEHRVEGPAMIGVARVLDGTIDGIWERHDGGDELLVPIAGRFTITMRRAGSADQVRGAGPGDVILIPRGVAHSFKLHAPEVQLLFVTPRRGNTGWSESGVCVKRRE